MSRLLVGRRSATVTRPVTALALVRLALGAAEVVVPVRVGRFAFGHPPDRTERTVTRVLGARHLVQAFAGDRGPLGGPALDALHAASMLPVAIGSARYRRLALATATMATALALTSAVAD